MCHIFLIHSSAVGHLGSFHLVAVVSSARQYLFEVSPFYRETHRGSEQREDLPKEGIFHNLPDPKSGLLCLILLTPLSPASPLPSNPTPRAALAETS